ncbi:hypothetical protein RFI_38799, partial [Reticulomyxa filosa]
MSGCVPQGDRKNVLWSDVSAIGVQQIDQITYAVEQTLKVNVVKIWNTRKEEVKKANKNESESSSTDGKEKGGGGERGHDDHDHDNDNDEHYDDEATKTEGTTQEPTTILSKSQIQKWNNQQSGAVQYRKAGGAPLSMPKMRRHELEEIIPINTGCLNQ